MLARLLRFIVGGAVQAVDETERTIRIITIHDRRRDKRRLHATITMTITIITTITITVRVTVTVTTITTTTQARALAHTHT